MPVTRLPRLETGIDEVDTWIDEIVSAIERALNVTASGQVNAVASSTGLHFSAAFTPFVLAKSGVSGIPAMSGSTPGNANVTLYEWSGTALVSQTITEKGYNLSATAVGSSKWLIMARVNSKLICIWEDCG